MMETVTTVRKMMAGNTIIVPMYQRAYAWDTPRQNFYQSTHIDVFIKDIEDCLRAKASSPYYFGHFLFEEKQDSFHVIDGQQRLTTIVIFLSALFAQLKQLRTLTDDEDICYEDMIKRKHRVCFSTVDYDNQFFKEADSTRKCNTLKVE